MNLDSVLKSKDVNNADKDPHSQSYVLPVVMYGCWELEHKEGRVSKNWCFSTAVLVKTFESPMDSKKMKPSILEEINPEYSVEGLMLKLQ